LISERVIVPGRDVRQYDAIVVGSGITGGFAAKELCEKGLKTLLLERGPLVEHGQDYVGEHQQPWNQPFRGLGDRRRYEEEYFVQSRCYAFEPGSEHFFVNDRKYPYRHDPDKEFAWIRGYHLGGRSLTWGRQCYRWSDLDFAANASDGLSIDWPIRYADIARWYDYVEAFVGISGNPEGLPQIPDGQFLPPMPMNTVERHMAARIQSKFPERVMTIGRSAVLTQAHNGRAPCHYCGPCHRGCSGGSYFSSLSATLPSAQATGNLEIRTDSIVHSVIYDEQAGRATGVRVVDAITKQDVEYRARVIFLCASALGSTYIMLNSTSSRFPDGLSNDSGALGHYLMDHHFGVGSSGTMPGFDGVQTSGNRPNGIYVARYRNIDGSTRMNGFTRGYGIQGEAKRLHWSDRIGEPGLGEYLKDNLRRPGRWEATLACWGEMLPRYDNFVELTDELDEWGLPVMKIHCTFGDNELEMRKDMIASTAEMLEASGAENIEVFDDLDENPPGFCIHEMGTARMGSDPKTSVLNGWNQCHGVANVFVTDGACMTSSACQNPSITYMALTARACHFAVREMNRLNI
jgi:choline dehydrogenase-like flavoprotein